MDTVVQREAGMNWEIRPDIYPLPCVKETASAQCKELSSVLCDDLEGCEGGPRWKGLCIHRGIHLYPKN